MSTHEYLLQVLQEEASEIIKEASKINRFGLDSINPQDRDKVPNKEKLENEIYDFFGVIELLMEENIIFSGSNKIKNIPDDNIKIDIKKTRVKSYMKTRKERK